MEVFIGVDPGQKGGFAIIGEGRTDIGPWDDNTFCQVISIYKTQGRCYAAVEKVGAMPKQGVTSTFTFGKAAGYIEGILAASGIPYQLIPPQKWKKEFSLGSDKSQSIAVCERLFPGVNLYRTPKCTTKHDGMAEALLLAEYARRHMSRV